MLEQVREDVDHRISPILSEIVDDLGTLLRQEVALAKSELRIQASNAGKTVLEFVGAAVLCLIGGLLVFVGGALWIVQNIAGAPAWLAFFLVGLASVFVAFLLLLHAKSRLANLSLVPEKTIQSITETVNGER